MRRQVWSTGVVTPEVVMDWWTLPRRVITPEADSAEMEPLTRAASDDAVKILAGCGYDPGSQGYRLHSAINETTQHASIFCRLGDQNPHSQHRQFDMFDSRDMLAQCMEEADVVLFHMNALMLSVLDTSPQPNATLVRMYHGSIPREQVQARGNMDYLTIFEHELDQSMGVMQLGARWDHVEDSGGSCQFLGMTVPVNRYMQLREEFRPLGVAGVDRPLRVGHSPTYRAFKGTDQFLESMAKMKIGGVPIEVVLIEHMPHFDALRAKATCDVFFDSFWLGAQGSGLEAMAMGIPVIAGDTRLARLHRQNTGTVPWLFADRQIELEGMVEMMLDPTLRHQESVRQHLFVRQWHSYEAVAKRFEELVIKPKQKPVSPKGEPVVTPQPEPVVEPVKEPMRTT